MSPEDRNQLSEWIATKATKEIFDLFAKLGYTAIGEVVDAVEYYKK